MQPAPPSKNFNRVKAQALIVLLTALITAALLSLACSKSSRQPATGVLPTGAPTDQVQATESVAGATTESATAVPSMTPSPTPQPTPTQIPLPPALVDSDPPPGAELSLNSSIRLNFNQAMDHDSVEDALQASGFYPTSLEWPDDASLAIHSEDAFPANSTLGVSLDTSARSKLGLALSEPISLTFRTADELKLVQFLPEAGAEEIDPASAVVASFNRPVVPLGADPVGLPAAFTIDPAADGRGEWLNTSTYIFYPEPALQGGKEYSVQLNPELRSTDGSPLGESASWSFSTALPRLESIYPEPGIETIWLDEEFTLTFNQSMDPPSVEANLRLKDLQGSLVPLNLEWDKKNKELKVTPVDLLGRDMDYSLELDGQAQALGGTPLGSSIVYLYETVPELKVLNSDPGQGRELPRYEGIRIELSAPVPTQGLSDLVTIEPKASNLYIYGGQNLTIYADFAPATDYRLVISGDLTDLWGSRLGRDFTLKFHTAPLPPSLFVGKGQGTNFILSKDNSLQAQVSGLNRLPIDLGTVPVSDFIQMLGDGGYQYKGAYKLTEKRSWVQKLDVDPDQVTPIQIYVTPNSKTLEPGIYMMRFDLTKETMRYQQTGQVIVVSDVHLTFKQSATNLLVWAVDLNTNAPLADAPVYILDSAGNVVVSGNTDTQGIFNADYTSATLPKERWEGLPDLLAVIGEPGDKNFAVADPYWNWGVQPYQYQIWNVDYRGPHAQVYLYTDRPIYRPGQTVYFRGVVRQVYNGVYDQVELTSLHLMIQNGDGQTIAEFDLPLSEYGTVDGEFNLPEGARPGYYNLTTWGNENIEYTSLGFQVADYRKPEINLSVTFNSDQVLAGENLKATVNARYFFDAPAGNLPVSWRLYAQTSNFELPGYQTGPLKPAWRVSEYPSSSWYSGKEIASDEGVTAADGALALDITPPPLDEQPLSRQSYILEATIIDASNRPVSARATIQVNPANLYIGVKPHSWVGKVDTPLEYSILVVDWQGEPAGVRSLQTEFEKVDWVQDDTQPSGYNAYPKYKAVYIPVESAKFQTDSDGRARLAFTPSEPGVYRLSISGIAPEEARALTEVNSWVGGPGQVAWPDLSEKRLLLTADQDQYKPGDTAQVFVPNPFSATAQVLATVERGAILRHETLTLEPGGGTLSFPLDDADAPNVYISVTLLGVDTSDQADFRQGYVNLDVAPLEQTLDVQITSQPERAGPGEPVQFEIMVKDAAGQPVQGEFSLAVVDLAALALADPNSVDILPAFYSAQPLGVATGIPLTLYAGGSVYIPEEGGRGGGGGEEAVSVTRENFPDTAYWKADIVTGADGKAQATVNLPDTLTTWQIETRGLTKDTRVGQSSTQVVTTKDLLIRPVTPRFLVAGDHVQLSAIVQNNTGEPLQATVAIQAAGFILDDLTAVTQAIDVPANGLAQAAWWGTARADLETDKASGTMPVVDLIFSASAQTSAGETLQDATRPAQGSIPVLHYVAPQTFRTAGSLDQEGEKLELISLPGAYDPAQSNPEFDRLDIDLSPSLAAAMLDALDVLEHYPYECTEQILSRFLPNMETLNAMQSLGVPAPDLEDRLGRTLDQGMQILLSRQNFDGGWNWWSNDQSDPYITAYVLFGLSRAQKAGFDVAPSVLDNAVNYLNQNLSVVRLSSETWELDRLAFERFALTEAGFGNLTGLQSLYKARARLSPHAQALLAISLETLSPGNVSTSTLISDIETAAIRSAAGAYWQLGENVGLPNMMTDLTNTAMVLYTLAQDEPGSPLVADATRWLMAHRQPNNAWSSTYATSWTIMALSEVMKGTGELSGEFAFNASLNGSQVTGGQASGSTLLDPVTTAVPLQSLYPDAPNALQIQHGAGPGRLYYSAALNVSQPVKDVTPVSQGMNISRAYCLPRQDTQGSDTTSDGQIIEGCVAVQSANAGDKITVRLLLNVPRDMYFLVVEDYIPAGAEILDTSLKTVQQYGVEEPEVELQYDPSNPYARGWGWWYFQDPLIYDDHIAWAADFLPAGAYELTYTLVILQPGAYHVLPSHAWQFYFPEVQGTSAGDQFVINNSIR